MKIMSMRILVSYLIDLYHLEVLMKLTIIKIEMSKMIINNANINNNNKSKISFNDFK